MAPELASGLGVAVPTEDDITLSAKSMYQGARQLAVGVDNGKGSREKRIFRIAATHIRGPNSGTGLYWLGIQHGPLPAGPASAVGACELVNSRGLGAWSSSVGRVQRWGCATWPSQPH